MCKSVGLLGGVIWLERFDEGVGVLAGVGFWVDASSLLLLDVAVWVGVGVGVAWSWNFLMIVAVLCSISFCALYL